MTERATFAGGCFWCLEAVFLPLRGVSRVVSGYTGGNTPNPSYQAVCSGMTGHAEAIEISFDPAVISYRTLLELFFAFHDPTTLDRQGPDEGTQYRSAIFAHSREQAETARAVIAGLDAEGVFPDPIVTEVCTAGPFYSAESYHQDYYRRNPDRAYCRAMIGPKVAKLRSRYRELLRSAPDR
ncbi:MAG TPA: peptide-methionine (S)-S-oxide reductase MsrA [Gemmatimonadales bacterium]|nr:peptide-methionine (S)-S-oxide reductase MsrA [Gemmatimonadales bacterium]